MSRVMNVCVLLLVLVGLMSGCSQESGQKVVSDSEGEKSRKLEATQSGEVLFKRYCSSCHPDGGNVSDPDRTLFSSVLKRNRLTTPDDIVRIMRHPISRMIRFDADTLSDGEARAIAEYVLTAFK